MGGSEAHTKSAETGDEGWTRREFVRAATFTAVGAGAGAVGVGLLRATWDEAEAGREDVLYPGAEVLIGSPTKVGLSVIPIRVRSDGAVEGRTTLAGVDVLKTLACGQASRVTGMDPEAAVDDRLRFWVPRYRSAQMDDAAFRAAYPFADKSGQVVHVEDLESLPVGESVLTAWRGATDDDFDLIPVQLMRLDPDEVAFDTRFAKTHWMDVSRGLIAFSAWCTHFCCVLGYHEDPTAEKLGLWDTLFCTCHNARFDPRSIKDYEFTFDPRRGDPGPR